MPTALRHHWLSSAVLGLALIAGNTSAQEEAAAPEVQRVEVRMSNYRFEPDTIVVRKDIPVELTLKNESALSPHEFVIDNPALQLETEVDPYASTTLQFTPTLAGEYQFSCNKKLPLMKSHAERGMHGLLRVE